MKQYTLEEIRKILEDSLQTYVGDPITPSQLEGISVMLKQRYQQMMGELTGEIHLPIVQLTPDYKNNRISAFISLGE